MTIDERLQFLVQSTESLHASAQELHSGVIGMREAIVELREIAAEHTRQLQIDAENIRSLANIAAAHEQRLDNLGGR